MSSNTKSKAGMTGWTSRICMTMMAVIIIGISVLIVQTIRTIDLDLTHVPEVLENLTSEQVGQGLP